MDSTGRPAEAVNKKKKRHIYAATQYYLMSSQLMNKEIRMDVIEIYNSNKQDYHIVHIKNAILEQP